MSGFISCNFDGFSFDLPFEQLAGAHKALTAIEAALAVLNGQAPAVDERLRSLELHSGSQDDAIYKIDAHVNAGATVATSKKTRTRVKKADEVVIRHSGGEASTVTLVDDGETAPFVSAEVPVVDETTDAGSRAALGWPAVEEIELGGHPHDDLPADLAPAQDAPAAAEEVVIEDDLPLAEPATSQASAASSDEIDLDAELAAVPEEIDNDTLHARTRAFVTKHGEKGVIAMRTLMREFTNVPQISTIPAGDPAKGIPSRRPEFLARLEATVPA